MATVHATTVRLPASLPSATRRSSADQAARIEQIAFEHGRSYDSYLATDPDRSCFWSRTEQGAVSYVRRGKYVHAVGGLLAPEAHQTELLAEFVASIQSQGLHLTFYSVAESELPMFRAAGFQITKWGEDAVLDLARHHWSGAEFAWIRRQTNYCRRNGVEATEVLPDALAPAAWTELTRELHAVSAARLTEKAQTQETGFVNGRFDPDHLGRRRLWIARTAERVEGFVVGNPSCNGREWSLELFRQRSDAVRGTTTFLLHHALQQLQHEGIARASLCLVPALRCADPLPGDSRLLRWSMRASWRFNFVFDVAGLYHYKSRFRPRFENRYVCALPHVTLGSFRSFTQLCGATSLSPWKLCRGIWNHWRKAPLRANMAIPE